jgi:hypothetical protein
VRRLKRIAHERLATLVPFAENAPGIRRHGC